MEHWFVLSNKISLFLILLVLVTLILSACAENSLPLQPTTNQEPKAVADAYQVTRAGFFAVEVSEGLLANDTDPEEKPLTVSVETFPSQGELLLKPDGSFSYQHDGSADSLDSFRYKLSDGEKSSSADVTLTIKDAGPLAGAEPDHYELEEGGLLQVSADEGLLKNDDKSLGSGSSVKLLLAPEHGSLDLKSDGSFSYQHDHSESGSDRFVYERVDQQAISQAEVSLNIIPVEDAPVLARLELAQTHVIAAEGKRWDAFPEDELHLVAEREALVLVTFDNAFIVGAELEGFQGDVSLGTYPLNEPSSLPKTEANGRRYSELSYWTILPANWLKPGLELRFLANDRQASERRALKVGASSSFTLYTLPFYLFGADESLVPFSQTAVPDAATQNELFAKWPVANLSVLNHPAKKIVWDYIIVAPRQGRPAQKVSYKEAQGDGYAVMSAVLNSLSAIRSANGDGPTSNQYYAPLIMATQSGAYGSPGGGLGGGHLGTGDYSYTGIFIHEQGHAFGIPHVGEAYNNGDWPYVGGSLLGSSWGFDSLRQEFLDIRVPATANNYKNCAVSRYANQPRQMDTEGYCLKQDPMQLGAGDSDPSYRFSLFSDFSTARMQRYFEGQTSLSGNVYKYSGGRIFEDAGSSTSYSRWNSLEQRFDEVALETDQGGLSGFDGGLPTVKNVPVQTLIITYSKAATAGVSQIYPPITYMGNLRRLLDPRSAEDLASIIPNTSENYWFCRASGCDYSLKIIFADNSARYVLLQGGFRKWFSDAQKDNALDPISSDSYKIWSLNLPAEKEIKQVELLETPTVWQGLPESPDVLLSCSMQAKTWTCLD